MVSALWTVAYAQSLPDGVNREENFRPGRGESLGLVQQMQGSVFVIHEDQPETAFSVMKGIPLFKGDTVITAEDGKVSLELRDGSLVTLTVQSSLVISEDIFDEKNTKERASFISVNLGKVRFFVKKLLGFDRSDFKVKTKTAIVGVRGSDFVVEAEEISTRVTALENTLVEVISLSAPCKNRQEMKNPEECEVEPIVLTDFRQAVITADGQIAVAPHMLGQEQSDILKQEFIIRPGGEEFRKDREEDGFSTGILVSNDKLVPPEPVREMSSEHAKQPEITGINSGNRVAGTMAWHTADEMKDEVSGHLGHDILDREIRHEPEIGELPGFPGSPE